MELLQSVARLRRAGEENSRTNQKLREAVDGLARHLATVLPQTFILPRNYYFSWWPSGDYELGKHDGTRCRNKFWKMTQGQKSRLDLFTLADDIADGWLDEVSTLLETEIAHLKQVVAKLDQFSNH